MSHSIHNAHEAYWFLHEHPKLQIRERSPETVRSAKKKIKRTRVLQDACGFWWREWRDLTVTPNADQQVRVRVNKTTHRIDFHDESEHEVTVTITPKGST